MWLYLFPCPLSIVLPAVCRWKSLSLSLESVLELMAFVSFSPSHLHICLAPPILLLLQLWMLSCLHKRTVFVSSFFSPSAVQRDPVYCFILLFLFASSTLPCAPKWFAAIVRIFLRLFNSLSLFWPLCVLMFLYCHVCRVVDSWSAQPKVFCFRIPCVWVFEGYFHLL